MSAVKIGLNGVCYALYNNFSCVMKYSHKMKSFLTQG